MLDLQTQAQDVHRQWLAAMGRGDFEEAWRQTDRLEAPRRSNPPIYHPEIHLRWNGVHPSGQHVLVRCLHGLGDTLQFIRYLPQIRDVAASVVTLAQPALLPLLRTTPALGPILDGWADQPPRHTLEIEVMELPYVFRSTVDTLPSQVPYLDLQRIQAESTVPAPAFVPEAFQVGLIWAASSWNPSRSIPLAALAPLAAIPGVIFHSLQQDGLEESPPELPLPFRSLFPDTSAILDAAAAMLQLDLIITVDTLSAHLAGALGCPVWLLLQHRADWRWQETGTQTPWYPTMKIFRQPSAGDWDSVGREVAHELSNVCRANWP